MDEVVWAKVKGYPWWPATVPYPRDLHQVATVTFCGVVQERNSLHEELGDKPTDQTI